jgi:hypothetical protein
MDLMMWGALTDVRTGWNDASSVTSYIATDGLSDSSSWCQAPNGAHDQILISLFDSYFLSSWCRAPSPISRKVKVRLV